MRMKRLTLAVYDALLGAGVTPIALKGAVLAQRLYPDNPLCRPSSDVDVLVRLDELPAVELAVRSLGLARQVDASLEDVFEDHHHVSFVGQAGLVEAHFSLIRTMGRGRFADAEVRGRSVPFDYEGRLVRVLAPEDEFLYLATHAANHGFMRIAWLVDLQRFLHLHANLDYDVMASRARDAGFLEAFTIALELLERLLAVELPQQARRAFPCRRRQRLDRVLFSGERVESGVWSTHRLGSFALRLWMVDSPLSGIHHLVDGARRYTRALGARR